MNLPKSPNPNAPADQRGGGSDEGKRLFGGLLSAKTEHFNCLAASIAAGGAPAISSAGASLNRLLCPV